MGWGTDKHTHTHKQTHKQTDRHISAMTRPGLRAGPSENQENRPKQICLCFHSLHMYTHTLIHYKKCQILTLPLKVTSTVSVLGGDEGIHSQIYTFA